MDNSEAKKPTTSISGRGWGNGLDDVDRREQLKLIYDYIKFHIGLYLTTPAVIGLLGNSFGVLSRPAFRWGIITMMCIFFVAGAHASWFIGRYVNTAWDKGYLDHFQREAFSWRRRILHHWLYWLGLLAGLGGLVIA